MDELFPWVWALLALIFMVAEIFTAAFVIICFGIGAALAAVLAFMGFGIVWQMLAFIVGSAIAIVLSRPFANRISGQQANTVGIDRVLQKEAIVIVAIEPSKASGRVRVEREEWLADTVDGSMVPVGSKVKVVKVEGTRLRVQPLA